MEMKKSKLMHEHGGGDPNFFQVNKEIVKKFGFGAALWLAYLHEVRVELIINDLESNLISEDDYVHISQQDIKEKTGITFDIQRKIVKILKEAGIIKVKRQGLPSRNYYWIKKGY